MINGVGGAAAGGIDSLILLHAPHDLEASPDNKQAGKHHLSVIRFWPVSDNVFDKQQQQQHLQQRQQRVV